MNLTEVNNVAAVHEIPGPQKQGYVDQLTSGANAGAVQQHETSASCLGLSR